MFENYPLSCFFLQGKAGSHQQDREEDQVPAEEEGKDQDREQSSESAQDHITHPG